MSADTSVIDCPDSRAEPWLRGDVAATLNREFLLLTRNRTNLLLAIVPSAVYIVLFATSLTSLIPQVTYRGRLIEYADFSVPALMFSALLAAATASGAALYQERLGGMTMELWSYPLRRGSYIAGKLIAGTALVLVQTAAALVVALALFGGQWSADRWLALLVGAVIAALAFNGLYMMLASLINDFQRFTVMINVLAPILLFSSPSFYPMDHMSEPLRWIAMANPVTYGIAALRDSLLFGFSAAWPYFVLLAILAVLISLWVARSLARQSRTL